MMNFSRERYVRVYTRDTADFLELSFNAKGLWLLLLRKADRDGTIALGRRGVASVARVIGHPEMWPALEPALNELLDDRCLALSDDGASLVIPNFTQAQEATASSALRTERWRERKRRDAAEPEARDETSHRVTKASSRVTNGDVSSPNVTGGDEVKRDATERDALRPRAVPYRTVPNQHPPYPPRGDSGRDGTSDQPSEDERRADVEAVASVGRTIDPSLDRDAVDERRATERDPAEREPVDPMRRLAGQLVRVLNEHSGGRVSLSMLSSAQFAALRAKLEELDASSDGVDVEDCAVLAVWAQFSDGLRWAKEPVGPAWLLKESNLASALSNALGWWRSRGHRDSAARSAHRAALRSLGVQTQNEPAPPPRAPSPPASEPFVPVSRERVREILGRGRRALPQPPSSAEGPSVNENAPDATVVRPVAEDAPTATPTRRPRVSNAPTDPEERRQWNREQVARALEEERRAPAARVSPSQPPPAPPALASGDDHRGVR